MFSFSLRVIYWTLIIKQIIYDFENFRIILLFDHMRKTHIDHPFQNNQTLYPIMLSRFLSAKFKIMGQSITYFMSVRVQKINQFFEIRHFIDFLFDLDILITCIQVSRFSIDTDSCIMNLFSKKYSQVLLCWTGR
jgi:hypothetical protein